ncbi:MAG TPA: hypothetical protein QF601_00055, partial [Dehalococcoidia bacterium]|nr:hypothetical protein [Dehalococcoidia bacterium]
QLDLGFSHLNSRAGFGLSHSFLIDYTSNDSRWQAYFTGVVNTIRILFFRNTFNYDIRYSYGSCKAFF